MKKALLNALPRWLLTWLVCVALDLCLGQILGIGSRWWLVMLVLLLWCAALAVTERFGRFWAMLALWTAALALCLLLSDRERLTGAALAILSRTEAPKGGELVLLMLSATVALPFSALLRHYWVRAVLSLGFLGLWIAAALLEWPLPRPVPAALIPLLLLTLTETIRRFRHESEPGESLKRALLLSFLPAALLLALLPARAEPYDYPLLHSVADAVERLWHNAETSLHYRHGGDQEFGLSFNGVSDEANVGESTDGEGPVVIYANPKQTPDGALYLFGNCWDHFDGRGWSSTLEPEDAELLNWKLDTAEHVYALWRMLNEKGRPADFPDYFRVNSVYLSCRNMNVRTMFHVMNTTRIFTDEERYPYAEAPTGSLFSYVQKEEVWYRVHFLEPNARTIGELIGRAEGRDYDPKAVGPRWGRLAEDYDGIFRMSLPDSVNLERTFARRAERIRSAYLDCSEVSERAAALAEEITADCASDYEKLAAIAGYLQANYSYTLSPEPVPKDENFLDWMLFERREGYCAWYATAAVLLTRSVGVPARYVQGYRSRLPGDVFTPIGSEDAHAWCECYIAGYGWVTVEATPGFKSEGAGWLTAAEERASDGEGADGAMIPGPGLPSGEGEEITMTPMLPIPVDQIAADEKPASEQASAGTGFGWVPTLVLLLLPAALLTVWFWRRERRRRRYAEADPAARLQMDLERLLRDLRGKGYPRKPEESLRQYFERLPWRFLLVKEAEVKEMVQLYDRAFFSPEAPSEEELARHRAFAAHFRPRTLRQWIIWYGLQR